VNELRLTLGWVAQAMHGRLRAGDPGRLIGEVVTDSRSIAAGELFVALRGPRFDGHTFVPQALERGAAGVVVDRAYAGAASRLPDAVIVGQPAAAVPGVIEVDDTLRALQDLAHAVRTTAGTRVVAITGSAGKTTTKDTIAELLATRARVVKNKGNLNNHIGLPLSLMQLRARPDVAVMELGMNHQGEISTLVAIAAPDVRVWTNVGDAHLGFFASPDAIADAKAEILEEATADTVLVANADDSRVMTRIRGFVGRTLTFGLAEHATVRALDVADLGVDGMRARVSTPVGERQIATPLLGRGNLLNVLAAAAVALNEGVPLDEIARVSARLHPSDRRGVVRRLTSGITVIDDSYNSSPAALRAALAVLAGSRSGRRVAVVGEMLELGGHTTRLHEACGRAAAESGVDLLIAVGGAPARALADAAIAAGLPETAVRYIETSSEAADLMAAAIAPGDLVLVKGSRGTRTDLVVDRLVAERG
jgi:UDP-N-acetylmuramoyl-tripeptide--D-alanyl-D-alanine ligase